MFKSQKKKFAIFVNQKTAVPATVGMKTPAFSFSYIKGRPTLMKGLLALVMVGLSFAPFGLLQKTVFKETPTISIVSASGDSDVDVWWPTDGAVVSGTQPFKAMLTDLSIDQYTMYWQVDGGQLNLMPDNFTNSPHKEASVDLSGWTWHGSGPYTIGFVAKDTSGQTIAQKTLVININSGTSSSSQQPAPAAASASPAVALISDVTTTATAQPAVAESGSETATNAASQPTPTPTPLGNSKLDVWWPTDGAVVSGTQPFKVVLENADVNDYTAFWQVDNGDINSMPTNTTDSPHKEASVGVSKWNWNGSGVYRYIHCPEQHGHRSWSQFR